MTKDQKDLDSKLKAENLAKALKGNYRYPPERGDEWNPERFLVGDFLPDLIKEEGPEELHRKIEELHRKIEQNVGDWIRDKDLKKKERIKDPLAFYTPYHSSTPGIYFRIKRMESDFFQKFIVNYSTLLLRVSLEGLWHLYVMVIFWHELAHHVLEDIATLMEDTDVEDTARHYPILSSKAEEGFCEFNAFETISKGEKLAPPRNCTIPPLTLNSAPTVYKDDRLAILSSLYCHWGRSSSKRRPVVAPEVVGAVNSLWFGVWRAHKKGCVVLEVPEEVYNNIWVTTF